MKKKEWNEGLNHLDPDLVEEYVENKENLKNKKNYKSVWIRLGSVAACFVLIIGISFIISRFQVNNTQYAVLEIGGYDNLSGANHKTEIILDNKEQSKLFISPNKTINVNGIEWNVDYTISEKGYLYKNNLDYYEKNENGVYVQIGINEDTGVVDSYSWVDVKYTENKNVSELTEEDCLDVAKTYLSKFVTSDEYEVVNIRYMEIPEYKAIFDIEFVRVIDGVKTSDKAYIGVTVFGDVISHLFVSLGEMADATLPTDEEMKIIEANVDEKLDTIYGNVSADYDVSYEIADKILVKLSDGRYAFEYYVTVDLKTKDAPTKITETTKLLIYLD